MPSRTTTFTAFLFFAHLLSPSTSFSLRPRVTPLTPLSNSFAQNHKLRRTTSSTAAFFSFATQLHHPTSAVAAASQAPFKVSSGLSDDDDLFGALPSFEDDDDDMDQQLLASFLPVTVVRSLPPLTRMLVLGATKRYMYGADFLDVRYELSSDWMAAVIQEEYISVDAPVQVGDAVFDGQGSKLLSLAAQCRLPKNITLELLLASSGNSMSLQLIRQAFAQTGWEGVSFPSGLALQLKKQYVVSNGTRDRRRRLAAWLTLPGRRRKQQIQEAEQLVTEAQSSIAPQRKPKSKQEFLSRMEEELTAISSLPTATRVSEGQLRHSPLLFFPNRKSPLGVLWSFWRSIKRIIEKESATLKSKGRAGFVSYCLFNFVFYSVGVLWQWQRVAPADPFAAPSVLHVIIRKFGHVFGSLLVASQLIKIPKLFFAVAMVPITERSQSFMMRRLKVPSANLAAALQVGAMVAAWVALVSIPIVKEYTMLHRLVRLQRQFDLAQVVEPAFRMVTYRALVES